MSERISILNLQHAMQDMQEGKLHYVKHNHLTRYLHARSLLKPGDLVVEIACGTGYGSKLLGMHGCKVFAYDISKEALDIAAKHNAHPNVVYRWGDIQKFSEMNWRDLDGIVCFETLEHIAKGQEEIAFAFKESLKDGAPAICSIPLNHPDRKWHKRVFSYDEREKVFECFGKRDHPEVNASLIVGWKE